MPPSKTPGRAHGRGDWSGVTHKRQHTSGDVGFARTNIPNSIQLGGTFTHTLPTHYMLNAHTIISSKSLPFFAVCQTSHTPQVSL